MVFPNSMGARQGRQGRQSRLFAGLLFSCTGLGLAAGSPADVDSFSTYFPPGADIGTRFGAAIDATTGANSGQFVVGCPGDPNDPGQGGTAFVMKRVETVSSAQARTRKELRPTDVDADDRYGASVAMLDEWIAVSAPGNENPSGADIDVGRVYIWRRGATDFDWSLDDVIDSPNNTMSAGYGEAVDLIEYQGNLVLAVGHPQAGQVFISERVNGNWSSNSQMIFGGTSFGAAISLGTAESGDVHLAVGSPNEQSPTLGRTLMFSYDGNNWMQTAALADDFGHIGDHFGSSLAVSGSQLVVGAPNASLSKGAVIYFDFVGGGNPQWEQAQRFLGMDGSRFGSAVTMASSTTAAVMADEGGYATFFERSGASWGFSPTLIPNSVPANQHQGGDIALSDENGRPVVLFGAPLAELGNSQVGRVHDFELNQNIWVENAGTSYSFWADKDRIGTSVDIEAGLFAAGVPGDSLSASEGGALYVYQGSSSFPMFVTKLTAGPNALAQAELGSSVAVSKGRIAGGAPGERNAAGQSQAGALYVFSETSGDWALESRLAPASLVIGANFGASVGFSSGKLLAVGAPGDRDPGGFSTGSAYVYRDTSSGWQLESKLTPPGGANGSFGRFGQSIAADETRVIVGAPFRNGGNSESGEAFVYLFDGNSWTLEQTLAPPTVNLFGSFGNSVAIRGNRIAVGEPDFNFASSGRVHLFERSLNGWQYRETVLPTDGEAGDNFGEDLAFDAEALLVGAPNAGIPAGVGISTGASYLFQVTPSAVNQLCTLINPSTDAAGRAVALDDGQALIGSPFSEPNTTFQASGLLTLPEIPDASGPEIFCFAEADSASCVPWTDYSGSPSFADSDMTLSVHNCLNRKSALMMFSLSGPNEIPFFGKTLCITPPLGRTPIMFTAGNQGAPDCSGFLNFDVFDWIENGNDPDVAPGVSVYAQFRYRDPNSQGGLNLANAIEIPFVP